MYPIPGHLSMGLIGAKVSSTPLIPVMLGTFLPDVMDKILADVVYLAPYGRCWSHTLLSVVLVSLLFYKFKGIDWALGWAVGHVLHLFGDIGFIPWFYPFISYEWPEAPNVTYATTQMLAEAPKAMQNYVSSMVSSASETVQSATGTVVAPTEDIGFWEQFSPLVQSVFIPKFIMIEGFMLLFALAIWWLPQSKKAVTYSFIAIFIAAYLYRISFLVDWI